MTECAALKTKRHESEENPLMLSLYDGVLKGRVHELLHVHYNHKEEE